MRATFVTGFVLAFAGVLAGAYLYPFVEPERVNSITNVALNGGRLETFVIRLPADRLASIGDGTSGLRGAGHPEGVGLPEAFGATGLLVEHFKLRNVDGVVIGLATRHWTFAATGPETVWALAIPGRGGLVLAGPGELPLSVDAAVGPQGYVPGRSWTGELDVEVVSERERTRVVMGSGEFGNGVGDYTETWQLTGVSESGELRGTIELITRFHRSS